METPYPRDGDAYNGALPSRSKLQNASSSEACRLAHGEENAWKNSFSGPVCARIEWRRGFRGNEIQHQQEHSVEHLRWQPAKRKRTDRLHQMQRIWQLLQGLQL